MKNFKNILWGVILIIIGIILGGNSLGLFDIDIFFDGWWALFIIIPSFVGLITDDDKTGNAVWMVIGLLLLAGANDIINFDLIWKMIVPIIIVIVGLSLIFKDTFNSSVSKSIKKLNSKINKDEGINTTFSNQNIKLDDEEFKGTNLNAIFGGIKLDLRNATIKDDVVINACSVFGGIDILVPDGYKVKVKSNSLFGGVSNNKRSKTTEKSKTIFIDANCLFGGVTIK